MEEKEVFPLWNCDIKQFEAVQGLASVQAPHVGDLRLLSCSGESSGLAEGESPIFIYGNADHKYIIKKVKDLKVSDNKAEFLITSYRPGEFSGISLIVTNGRSGFRVDDLSISTKSVLTKEIKEPYPSFGPFQLNIPKVYSVGLSLMVLLVAALVARQVISFIRRREFKKSLKQKHTPQSAYNDFTKSLRYWKRNDLNQHNLKRKFIELDVIWLEYLESSYFLPNSLSVNKALRVFKKENKELFKLYGHDLKKCCIEFKSAHKDIDKLTIDGVSRLHKQSLKTASLLLSYHQGVVQ